MGNNFAKNLKRIRKERNLSRGKLASMACVGVTTLYGYEAGNNEPTLTFLIAIANALGVSLDDLVFSEEKQEKKKPYIRA